MVVYSRMLHVILLVLVVSLCSCEKKQEAAAPAASDNQPAVKESEMAEPVMQAGEFTAIVPPKREAKDIAIKCVRKDAVIVADGKADEVVWGELSKVVTLDCSSGREIELCCFHDGVNIYFLARYPDGAASESHKSWGWSEAEQVYKPLPDREDMLVYKWLMTGEVMGFGVDVIEPHTADIWFWKARRTNPSGYFDDKMHLVTTEESKGALAIESKKNGKVYLLRVGDEGKSAYEEVIPFEYEGKYKRKYLPREPEGSRADVQGKGVWSEGYWTIELARKLDTGHEDDVRFVEGGQYRFGVCLYEMAATGVYPELYQPLYRTGDVFDNLVLEIE